MMASLLNTTAKVQHVTPIPSDVTPSKAISLIQGHELIINCDPHMIKYKPATIPTPQPTVASDRQVTATAEPKCYEVTDRVHALPAGLWDSDVVSTCEFINIENGVFVRIRCPLSVVMETVWEIRERERGDGHELVEEVVIKCSRLLVGVVKSQCDAGWEGIHQKMVEHMKEDL